MTDVGLQAYVEVIKKLGPVWLERNMSFILKHLIELVAKFGALSFTRLLIV